MKTFILNTINDFHELYRLDPPKNPFFTIAHVEPTEGQIANCEGSEDDEISITTGFFNISFKQILSGTLTYGRTKYDSSTGTLLFNGPNQTMILKGLVVSEGFHISFHRDYLNGTPLYNKIKRYNFFNYNANEALHLSDEEEEIIRALFLGIKAESNNSQDEFSKAIIISHLEALLKYSDRFYKRQFLNRKEINQELYTRFRKVLNDYFETEHVKEKGIPSVEWIAEQLGVSQRYMTDTIKAETGKTAVYQINQFLIEEAKNMLLTPGALVTKTAYELGFKYPHYFSRLFKQKTGISPKEYIESQSLK